jgi:hypothetical protein
MRRRHNVAARLAGVGAFETAHAGKPDCYGAMYTDQMSPLRDRSRPS